MKTIYSGVFGSKLYGTAVENSDTDLKNIHMASLSEIILKQDKDDIQHQTNSKTRNDKDDVDFESKELRKFIHDCLKGQTYAMDVLFTPKHLIRQSSPIWDDLLSHKDKLVTRNVMPFIGYCKSQSSKYSEKSIKLQELSEFCDMLKFESSFTKTFEDVMKDSDFDTDKFTKFKHIKTQMQFNPSSGKDELMLIAADSAFPVNRKVDLIFDSVHRKVSKFGERVQLSRVTNGCDFKAFYHALRVCWELEELLEYGYITFPSKRVNQLLMVRKAEKSREEIEEFLTSEIDRVLKIPNNLPEADHDFWNGWILEAYLKEKKNGL